MGAIVVVQNLRKRYGATEAVRDVSFSVDEGVIFGLLGPNGAGKSTLVECLLGLRAPDGGRIEICGLDAQKHPREVKRMIGAALQTTALQDKLTPREALKLFASFYENPAEPDALLTRFALSEKADAPFDTLSGGQRQRLALALAFVNQPRLVVLDEPTTGLDPEARHELQAEILQLKRDGHTVLMTTHQLDEAERLCDVVAIIDRGSLLALGAPKQLIAGVTPHHRVTLETARPLVSQFVISLLSIQEVTTEGNRTQFRTAEPEAVLPRLLAELTATGNTLVDLHVQKGSLEEFFLGLTKSMPATSDGVPASSPLSPR